MRKCAPLLLVFALVIGCGSEQIQQPDIDSTPDSNAVVVVPQFDISGAFRIRLNNEELQPGANGPDISILNAKETDTLFLQYDAAVPCEECRLETQIWVDTKYKDLVRDTGYGTGKWTAIPLTRLDFNADSNEAQNISFYLSVRQYHPVETGNKRFLFDLKLAFAPAL
jgi:hypothetical protein